MTGNIDTLNFSLSKSEIIRICDFTVYHQLCAWLYFTTNSVFKISINNGISIMYIINIFITSTILFSVISNWLKLSFFIVGFA